MDWKRTLPAIGTKSGALALSLAFALGPVSAHAAEVSTGQWQTLPNPTYVKLAKRVDQALVAQSPKPKVKTSTSKKLKTVTVNVSCRAKKAGIQRAMSKRVQAYSSLRMKLYADNLYRSEKNEARVTCDKTVHGVNNYGRDNATDYSLSVGKSGKAKIFVRYEGVLCTYKNAVFRKANYQKEVYWNQTKRIKVASMKVPKGYRLKLHLTKR